MRATIAHPSTYQPRSRFGQWLDTRLPIARVTHAQFIDYPTPRNRKSGATSCAIVVIAAALSATTVAEAADTFRKLNDSELRSKVSGMEIVDVEDHWAEQYMRDGSLKVFSMSKVTTGKWRVQELCIEEGTPDSGCGEVWISGNKIEFRGAGPRLGLEGVLQKQQPRK